MKNYFLITILISIFLTSCATKPPKVIREVIRDTIIINKKTDKYESARIAKLDKYKVSTTYYPAIGQDDRVRFLILHYTALDNEKSIRVLSQQEVSAHYLIPNDFNDSIYVLVDESKRAWHAGVSYWKGINNINFSSIGIEIVNMGYNTTTNEFGESVTQYYDYPYQQITKLAALMKDITDRYKIEPINILGHSDIAPQRKYDPGPKFPWKRLYSEFGLGAWYEDVQKDFFLTQFPYSEIDSTSFIMSVQNDLNNYGYEIQKTGIWDEQTKKVIAAFQHHFRPERYDGILDPETWAILKSLILKYRS